MGQREQRGQDSLERIFFHVVVDPLFLFPGSRGQSFVCRPDRHNVKKSAQWLLRATVRPCSVCFQFYSLLAAFLYTRGSSATGWNATPVTAEETISALH